MLSLVRLNQWFSATYRLPFHACLNVVHLNAAKQLFTSARGAADVAASVGLSDQSHLRAHWVSHQHITVFP
ncbi:hypothetical protein PEC301877_04700 [Pectobacterium carotovorum subsp. carotovorum]|nr:hypothetical protein PEC301877_04700 [Pectobacterium carotovorum subsp. carotovorum]